ncbi:hypothetical protein A2715_02750 [Candidatus Woesebacteria bacterium RIFCSPHIGHO2_01_FULL_39_32]|uniref:HAD family hydrolase n=1 Tax=Candidatus Woesebacteria bacterium RIFCSPLOWO2_01_FULL_39_25 TaxID=1802521 RepID=A0A1F8BK12_9BACT|nr:MAG: hypothetical protein A2124_01150 [Candidatus Woesebacteria bacterium GWB1_37_5]OGM24073.1 MAG: hypothetical protein A2715_02750 [Candidatus Woesebacteria bacterium RIFCSPHIGHO2_01_FULL_39_32]OGM37948.1 MAG: hypothetical protein A3F01_03010 [Candidatus Woesebacteria bacterium RIFCSPHIGHO2_12_FULL_38_11]OGM64416.1 MAG: hypothetical protein A2893_00925 [Candidatus Woesebacteria bacterium RIFCSPLOWO2_01_FULL_39_25]
MIKLIIFDFNRTLFNVEKGSLIPRCLEMLDKLSVRYDLAILSTQKRGRDLHIQKLFGKTKVKNTVIVDEKSTENFQKIMANFDVAPSETLIVGDYLKEEIAIGNKIGSFTVWFKNGKFSKEKPENKYEKPNFILRELNYINLLGILNAKGLELK